MAMHGTVSRRRCVVGLVVAMTLLYFFHAALHESEYDISASFAWTQRPQLSPGKPSPEKPQLSPDQLEPGKDDFCAGRMRENATMLMLARNSDLKGAIGSVALVEERFNRHCHYPWVFLNEEPFTEEFQKAMLSTTNSSVSFGVVPEEHWYQPGWIDESVARQGREKMVEQNIIYGDSVPYRNMCRFNSGFFFKQPLLQNYRYYWRVEPDIEYTCDVDYDPFRYMVENNKTYGFTISFFEWEPTIPTLWSTVKEFMALHPEYIADNNAMSFLSDDGGETYNLCHFWSNFEIADMDFWRGEAYQAFFDFLENKGGFYYERWGDAPVHSIAIALFAPRERMHFFKDIGYKHEPFQHCPPADVYVAKKCTCNIADAIDYRSQSCIPRFQRLFQ